MSFSHITISLMRSVIDCNACCSSACSCSYPIATVSYRPAEILPVARSSYRQQMMLSNSLVRFSILCFFTLCGFVKFFGFGFTVLRCHRVKFFRLLSCKSCYCFQIMQYDLVKHTFSDIECIVQSVVRFLCLAQANIFFRSVQIQPFPTVTAEKISGIFIGFTMLVRPPATFVVLLN